MSTSGDRKRIHVLLVEDTLTAAHLITIYLESVQGTQFEITHCRDLKGALERLPEGDIDGVLLDLGLPDSYGLETFIRIKEAAPEVPIVVFTGVSDEEMAL